MSVPMEQMEEPLPEEETRQMLSDEDEQDIDIAIAAALQMIDTPEGEEQIQKIMSQPNPAKLLALFLSQMIEAVMTGEGGDEINPAVWFAEGGVLDDMTPELSDLAGTDLSEIMPDVKAQTLEIIKKRAGQFQQEGQEAPPAQPTKPPPILARG